MRTKHEHGWTIVTTGALLLGLSPWLAAQAPGAPPGVAGSPGSGAVAPAQAPAADDMPDTLEAMLAQALRQNPDVLLAEAKLRQAQAELNLARLKVTQDVVGLYHQRRSLQQVQDASDLGVEEARVRFRSGTVPQSQLTDALIAQAEAAADLAKIEAALRFTVGAGVAGMTPNASGPQSPPASTGMFGPAPVAALERPEMPAALREKLESIKIVIQWNESPLRDVLQELQDVVGLSFVVSASLHEYIEEQPITSRLNSATALAVLQAIADQCDGEVCFVFRDYGVLVTTPEAAELIAAPAIPAGIPRVRPR